MDFDKFIERHGEIATQALIENVEHYRGIRNQTHKVLSDRWHKVMFDDVDTHCLAA